MIAAVETKRWTRDEYYRLAEIGILGEDDHTELIEGEIYQWAEPRRWTREEYERMADAGLIGEDDRVQLIRGRIVQMAAMKGPHAAALELTRRSLAAPFGPDYWVRDQLPLPMLDDSYPEPDLAVVRGEPNDYLREHPTAALLVVEISDSTLAFDRREKAPMYAAAAIPEYWIVNLTDRQLEVYRDPTPEGYRTRTILRPGDEARPLARPEAAIPVAGFFPRQ